MGKIEVNKKQKKESLLSIAIYSFAVPADFPMTGVSGVALIFYQLFGLPVGVMTVSISFSFLSFDPPHTFRSLPRRHSIAGKRHEYAAHRALQQPADWILMTLYERLSVSA